MNRKVFTLLMVFAMWLLVITAVKAEAYLGIAQGIHLGGEQLHDTHPYVGIQKNGFGILAYQNSFKKLGIAPYYEMSGIDGFMKIALKVGATTGYHPQMKYGDKTYRLGKQFFFNDDIMLLLIPSIGFYDSPISLDITLLGDSLNIGFTYFF